MCNMILKGETGVEIKVLITSPAGYSQRFKNEFAASHLQPEAIPMIETVVPEACPEVDHLLGHIAGYDYVVFSSRKGIESFAIRLAFYPEARKEFKNIKFCAIGKDAEYLYERLQLPNAITTKEASPMGIADKLAEVPDITKKSIAVLVPLVEKIKEPDVVPNFITRLTRIGMKVTRVNAYITRPVASESLAKAVSLITTGETPCVAFTSSAEIEVLLSGFPNNQLPKETIVACFGPYTAAFARKKGLKVSIVAKDFSAFTGFIKAIEGYYGGKSTYSH